MYDFVKFWRTPPVNTREDAERKLSELNFAVRFAYHSGRTENKDITWNDTLEIFETGSVSNFSGSIRTLFEIVGAQNAWNKALDMVYNPGSKLDVEKVLSLHAVLMDGCYDPLRTIKGETPGAFKKNFYVVGPLETGCAPEDAQTEMVEFLKEIQPFWELARREEHNENTILKVAAWSHCRFENIHAFADGNGRLGRLLLNMLLMRGGFPPVVFDFELKNRYCETLQAFHEHETIRPFMDFLVENLERTWRRQVRRRGHTFQSFDEDQNTNEIER